MFTSSQQISRDAYDASHAFVRSGGYMPAIQLLVRRAALREPPDAYAMLRLRPVHSLQNGALYGADVTLPQDCGASPSNDPQHATGWLLFAACVQGLLNADALPISVALPYGTRLDHDLVAQAEAALDRSGSSPGLLTLELGEDILQNAGADSLLALSALRDAGLGVAVGVSEAAAGMRAICRLPVTCLRLQPRLVQDLPDSRPARDAVEQAVEIAHALHASVVGSGARTALQRDILADLGVDAASGPVFGPALPAQAFRQALRETLYA